jgi:hypothetical protein
MLPLPSSYVSYNECHTSFHDSRTSYNPGYAGTKSRVRWPARGRC